jgi:BMFP domain-containing protein YqiC
VRAPLWFARVSGRERKSGEAIIEGNGFSRYSEHIFEKMRALKMNDKIFEGLSAQFSQVINTLNSGTELPGQQQIRGFLQSALSKMDLVTRDEFDAQSAVLARTREKVEQMEKVLAELESHLNTQADTISEADKDIAKDDVKEAK